MTRPRRRPGRAAGLLGLLALAAGGCAAPDGDDSAFTCRPEELVLLAQAVPTASKVPCISSFPIGWEAAGSEIEKGDARFYLDSDRAGHRAVTVSLVRRCDVAGATEIPSDEDGARRFERVEQVVGAYRGTRYYRFPGGCVSYRFEFEEPGRVLINEASLALGFVARDEIARQVADDGFELNPPPSG